MRTRAMRHKYDMEISSALIFLVAAGAILVSPATGVDMFTLQQQKDPSYGDLGGRGRETATTGEMLSPAVGFNTTSSFISHGPGGPPDVAADVRRRGHLTPGELRRLWRSAGCNTDEITLRCAEDPSDTIVVEDASFYALPASALNCSNGPLGPIPAVAAASDSSDDPIRNNFFPQLLGLPRMSRDLRQALNRRCSGLGKGQECMFNLALDHPESTEWGSGGLIDIFYRCAPRQATNRQCGDRDSRTVRASPRGDSRFLMSPVYPKYYVGGRRCRWQIRAEPGQRIQLRFLDVSLRERGESEHQECADAVSVSERGKTLMRMCGELEEDVMLLSEGHSLDVKLETRTKSIFPRRGILAEFWPVGCANQNPPSDGYLQFRNDSVAAYACSLGHVFLPELERTRVVRCVDRRWDSRVGPCYPFDYLRQYGNESILAALEEKYPGGSAAGGGQTRQHAWPSSSYGGQQQQADRGGGGQHGVVMPAPAQNQVISTSWFADVMFPVLVVGVGVILSLFAMIVLLLVKRHLQFESEGHPIDEDRSALTPCSLRRHSPPVLRFEIGGGGGTGSTSSPAAASGSLATTSRSGVSSSGVLPNATSTLTSSSSSATGATSQMLLQNQREELFLC